VLTMAVVNGACIVGAVILARRRGGRPLMLITAIAVVLMARSLSPEVLHDVWNPSAGLFPFTLLIFLCWSLACGQYRLLPLTVLVASFVVQCQLAFARPRLGLVVVALVGLGIWLRSSRNQPEAPRLGGRKGLWRWLLAAVLVAALCWTPPVIDQIQGSPGNLTMVLRTAKANPPTLGARVGWHALVRAIGVPPWWLRDPASPWERKTEVRTSSGGLANVSTVLILLLLAALVVVGVVRRHAELWAGALIALALCGSLAAVAASTPTMRVLAETLGYTMWWGSPAGMFVWVMAGWGAAVALAAIGVPGWRMPAAVGAAGVVVVAAVAAVVAAGQRPDYHLPEYRPLSAVYSALEHGVPAHRTVLLIGALGNSTFRFKMASRYALRRHGVRPISPGTDVRLGSWYEKDHHPYDCTLYVQDGDRRPSRRATLLVRTSFYDGTVSRPISVWGVPAGCPRRSAVPGRVAAVTTR